LLVSQARSACALACSDALYVGLQTLSQLLVVPAAMPASALPATQSRMQPTSASHWLIPASLTPPSSGVSHAVSAPQHVDSRHESHVALPELTPTPHALPASLAVPVWQQKSVWPPVQGVPPPQLSIEFRLEGVSDPLHAYPTAPPEQLAAPLVSCAHVPASAGVAQQ